MWVRGGPVPAGSPGPQAWVDVLRDSSIVKLEYVNTKANLSDFFTKILDYETFERLRDEMLVECPIPPTGVGG